MSLDIFITGEPTTNVKHFFVFQEVFVGLLIGTDHTTNIFPCQKIFSQNVMWWLYPVALCIQVCMGVSEIIFINHSKISWFQMQDILVISNFSLC